MYSAIFNNYGQSINNLLAMFGVITLVIILMFVMDILETRRANRRNKK